jgi:hypothetical protein
LNNVHPLPADDLRAELRPARLLAAASEAMSWAWLEYTCLFTFLVTKGFRLYTRWGAEYGHDAGDQIKVTNILGWGHLMPGLKECFNCYQPPLGFLVPKVPMALGLSAVPASVVSSFAAYLAAFFLLRATLAYLGVLTKPAAIAFLYLTVAIPLNTYLALAINLDSLMYAWSAGVLYTSVRVFWDVHLPPEKKTLRPLWAVLLTVLLASAALVKISGFTLYCVPVVVALVQRRGPGWRKRLARSLLPGVMAVALVSPYFYERYYKETGHFLVMNHEWQFTQQTDEGRKWRDEHPVRFWVEMFSPNPKADEKPNDRDHDRVRLHDWWRLYWVRSEVIGWAGESALRVSRFYLATMPVLVIVGLVMFLRTCRRGTIWSRLGWVFLVIGAIHLASMMRYLYVYPDALHIGVKPQYISPFMWTLAFALSGVTAARGLFPYYFGKHRRIGLQMLILLIVSWGIYNDNLGIY